MTGHKSYIDARRPRPTIRVNHELLARIRKIRASGALDEVRTA